MPHTILALMDASVEAPRFGLLAAEYASARDASLIVAIDPGHALYPEVAARMARCVHDCIHRGVRTSTMLVSLQDANAVLRAVRLHGADAVAVLDRPPRECALGIAIAVLEADRVPIAVLESRGFASQVGASTG